MNGDVIGSIIVLKIVFGLPVSPILDVLSQERSIHSYFIDVQVVLGPSRGAAGEDARMGDEIKTVHQEHVSFRINVICQFHSVVFE